MQRLRWQLSSAGAGWRLITRAAQATMRARMCKMSIMMMRIPAMQVMPTQHSKRQDHLLEQRHLLLLLLVPQRP